MVVVVGDAVVTTLPNDGVLSYHTDVPVPPIKVFRLMLVPAQMGGGVVIGGNCRGAIVTVTLAESVQLVWVYNTQ